MSTEAVEVSRRQRKVVFPFHYSLDKRLVHIVAKLRDEPGALASLLSIVGSKVNLVGTTSYDVEEGGAIFSGFGEILSPKDNAHSIQELASLSPKVLACEVWQSKEGFLVAQFHTGIQSALGEPYIMLPASGLALTFEKVVHTFGSGGETILFMQGKEFAETRFQPYREMLGAHPEKRINEAAHILEALGYGSSSVKLEGSGTTLRLVVKDCFECTKPSENGRSCAFIRGLAAGAFGALYRQDLVCNEIKCRLKGHDYCEFTLKAKDDQPLSIL